MNLTKGQLGMLRQLADHLHTFNGTPLKSVEALLKANLMLAIIEVKLDKENGKLNSTTRYTITDAGRAALATKLRRG